MVIWNPCLYIGQQRVPAAAAICASSHDWGFIHLVPGELDVRDVLYLGEEC
jgi:hypothetical protein